VTSRYQTPFAKYAMYLPVLEKTTFTVPFGIVLMGAQLVGQTRCTGVLRRP
jgi:hypothetical protein